MSATLRDFSVWVLLVALSGLACNAPQRGAESPVLPPPSSPEGLYALSPAAFGRLRAVRQPLPLDALDHDLLAAALFHEANRHRRKLGYPSLRHLPPLDDAARLQARAMAAHQRVSHEHPTSSALRRPYDRVSSVGLRPRFVAENVASAFGLQYEARRRFYTRREGGRTLFSYRPDGPALPLHTYASFAVTIVDQWMGSPGHRANILANEAAFMGHACAVAGQDGGMPMLYCAQLFFDAL